MHKFTIFSLCLIAFAGLSSTPALADYQVPVFPLCTNPQGTVIARYDTGSHAIAGQMSSQEGKDIVYKLDDSLNQVTQCYCPPTVQNGIQTNWLQASTLSEAERQQLQNNGWVFIENGSSWGLANAPYMAQNITYVCNGSGGSTPSSDTITAVVQATNETNTNTNNNPSSSSSSPNIPSSLPNTGDSIILLGLIGAGLVSLCISFLLKKAAA